jgi:hypothetical protein
MPSTTSRRITCGSPTSPCRLLYVKFNPTNQIQPQAPSQPSNLVLSVITLLYVCFDVYTRLSRAFLFPTPVFLINSMIDFSALSSANSFEIGFHLIFRQPTSAHRLPEVSDLYLPCSTLLEKVIWYGLWSPDKQHVRPLVMK